MSGDARRGWDVIPSLPKWVLSAVTFVAALVGFVQLLRGDQELVVAVVGVVAALAAWLASADLAFRRAPPEDRPDGSSVRAGRRTGVAGMALVPLLAVAGFVAYRDWAKSPDRAIARYTRAIERDPTNGRNYAARAEAYAEKGRFDRAIEDYDAAIDNDLDTPSLYISRGDAKLDTNDPDGAIQDYNWVIEHDKLAGWAYKHRGWAYQDKHDLARAIEDYDRAIGIDAEDDPGIFSDRGDARLDIGDVEGAIEDYKQAIELQREEPGPYRQLAVAYEKKGDARSAIDSMRKFLGVTDNPDSKAQARAFIRDLESRARTPAP